MVFAGLKTNIASKKFKTDRRLWFRISLVLFVVPWFLPIWGIKGDTLVPAYIFPILFENLFENPDSLGELLGGICAFSLFIGVPAVSIGWVLQCFIVVFKGMMKRQTPD